MAADCCSAGGAGVDAGCSLATALALVFGGAMLSAVGSVDAGQPSSARTSLGDSAPACGTRCQLA
jgi:hypothetical protein